VGSMGTGNPPHDKGMLMASIVARAASLLIVALAGLCGVVTARAAKLETARPESVPERALVVTYHVAPDNRAAFVAALDETSGRMRDLSRRGAIASYRLLVNRFIDSSTWDAMLIVHFKDDTQFGQWRALERQAPGGLTPKALALVANVDTVAADHVRHGGKGEASAKQVYLAIPYEVSVATDEYLAYLDGYVIPQTEGWRDEGVLAAYDIYLARFPAGRSWQSLLVLGYQDEEALGRRDATVAKVRERLKSNATWKAISDSKKSVRSEKSAVLLDELDPH
jgi:hypothetical protein